MVSCPLNLFRVATCDKQRFFATKIPLANFLIRVTLSVRAQVVRFKKESLMAWKAPKIVEVPVGMEINMYACAARK